MKDYDIARFIDDNDKKNLLVRFFDYNSCEVEDMTSDELNDALEESLEDFKGDSETILASFLEKKMSNDEFIIPWQYNETACESKRHQPSHNVIMENDRISEYKYAIISTFENFLDEKGLCIPNIEKTGDEDEAIIYGSDYDRILEDVSVIIDKLVKEIGGIEK